METYIPAKELLSNNRFKEHKKRWTKDLDLNGIDEPIHDIVLDFNNLPYAFTMQCCFGHFLYGNLTDQHNLEPIQEKEVSGKIQYRIAYIAFCVDAGEAGNSFLSKISGIAENEPDIQFGSADWFWDQQVNTYVQQVQPFRFKECDRMDLDLNEALKMESLKKHYFDELRKLFKQVLH